METLRICKCGKHGKYICSKCKYIHYCSSECQRTDWNNHKNNCLKWSKNIELLEELKRIENIREEKFTDDETRLLTSNFFDLDDNDKNKYLDLKMDLNAGDLINEVDACKMFTMMDIMKRYSDMLRLLIQYPKLISDHFENTPSQYRHNIEYNWDWNLEELTFITPDQWKLDLILTYGLIPNTKIARLIKSRVFKDKNIKKEYKRITKYIQPTQCIEIFRK